MTRLALVPLVALVAVPLAAVPPSAQDLAADHARMMGLFGGRFDNNLQTWQEAEDDVPDSLRHERIHSIFARVAVPALGRDVFYVQQSLDGDPDRVYRQRLYRFAPSPDDGATVLTIYAFPDDEAVRDAHLDPARLSSLAPSDLRAYPGCEVYWTPDGDGFRGVTRRGACRVTSRSGRELVIEDDLYLDDDEIWIQDRATTAGGEYVFGHRGGEPHKLRRADAWTGFAVVRADGTESAEPAPDSAFTVVRGLALHDEGDRVALVTADGRALGITVELAQLVYQASGTAILKLALYRDGQDRAFAYTWADPEAKRVGLNLRWVQVGLTRADAAR